MVAGSCHQMHMLNFQQHTLDCICYAMCVVRSVAFVAAWASVRCRVGVDASPAEGLPSRVPSDVRFIYL